MTRLRVALDARPLQSDPLGGVGRYLANVVGRLADDVEVLLLLDARHGPPRCELDDRVEQVLLPVANGLPSLAWLELAVAPWLRRFDGIYHGVFNVAPLSFRGPTVLTLHDLAPQLHAEDFGALKRAAWRLNTRVAVGRAAVVTTVSEFIKRQIVDYYGLPPERVIVAPDALDPIFDPTRAADAPALARSVGLGERYVVAVGGAPRRGLPIAVDAWRRVRDGIGVDIGLAVAGEHALPAEPGLVALGRLEDEAWTTLLAGAQALCYPTRYEGFGLPALEAMASGTPVVCGRVASLPEVLGDAACWSPELSAEAIAATLGRLLTDPVWHEERRVAGLARARSAPSWKETAAVLVQAYERAAARR